MAAPTKRIAIDEKVRGKELGLPLLGAVGSIKAHGAQRIAWHSHSGLEFIFLLSGATTYEFSGGLNVELSGGQFLLIPANAQHRGKQEIRMPSVFCGILLEPLNPRLTGNSPFTGEELGSLKKQFSQCEPSVCSMNESLRHWVEGIAELVRIFKEGTSGRDTKPRLRAMICLSVLEAVAALNSGGARSATGIVAAAEAFLREHSADPLRMDDLAAHLGFSRARMFDMFKKETGLSPNDFLQRHRVECAKELLGRGQLSITDIALTTGFGSSQYFSRVFRKYAGMTPKEFRGQK